MNKRLLKKKNSCWSTTSDMADATANLEICLKFENLALETAIKTEGNQTIYPQWHDQTLQKLFRTQTKMLPELKTKNNLQASKYLKTRSLNIKPRYSNNFKEPSYLKTKEGRSLSQMITETSFNTSNKLLNESESQAVEQFNRKKLLSLFEKQKELFQTTYGSSNFKVSEIQSGLISNETLLKPTISINELMQQKWNPIRNYEFSKLSRKDILPVRHSLNKDKAKLFQRRMSKTVNKQIFSNYQFSHVFSLSKKKQ